MATQLPITVQPNPPTLLPVLGQGNASRFTRDAPPISSSRQGNPPTSRSGSNLSKAKRHSMPNFNLKLMSRLRQPDFPAVSVSPTSATPSSSTPSKALEVTFTNPSSTMNAVTHSSVLSPMVFMDRADSTASVESVESSGSSRISSNSTNSGQSATTSATTGNLHPSTATLPGLRTKIIDGLPFIPPPRRRSFTSSGTSSSGTEDREFDRDSPFASELATPVDELGGTNSVFVASGKSNCQSGITMIRRRACGNASTDVGSQGGSGSGCSSGGSSAGVTYYGEAALTERLGKKRRSSSFLPIFPRAQSWNFGLRAASAETKEDKKVEEVKSQVTVMTVPAGTVGTVTDTVLTEKIREKDSKGSGVKIAAAKTAVRVRVKVKEAKERLLHGSHKVPLGGDLLSADAAGVASTEGVTPNLPSVPPNTPVPPINSDATKAEEAQVKTPPTSKPPSPKRRSRGNSIYTIPNVPFDIPSPRLEASKEHEALMLSLPVPHRIISTLSTSADDGHGGGDFEVESPLEDGDSGRATEGIAAIDPDALPEVKSDISPSDSFKSASSTPLAALSKAKVPMNQDEQIMEWRNQVIRRVTPIATIVQIPSSILSFSFNTFVPSLWSIVYMTLRFLFFLPWCALVGGTFLLSPQHLEYVAFHLPQATFHSISRRVVTNSLSSSAEGHGYLSPPATPIRRFAFWAEYAFAFITCFVGMVGVVCWVDWTLGTTLVGVCSGGAYGEWSEFFSRSEEGVGGFDGCSGEEEEESGRQRILGDLEFPHEMVLLVLKYYVIGTEKEKEGLGLREVDGEGCFVVDPGRGVGPAGASGAEDDSEVDGEGAA